VGVAGVNVEGGGDASGTSALIEAVSIVEEGFFGADLDEERWEIVKVSVERRDLRGFGVFAVEVLAGLVAEGILSADGVDGGFGDHGGAVACEVEPGGDAGDGGGGREAGGVGGGKGVEGEAGARGIADEGDVRWVEAVGEEIVVSGD